MRPDLRRSRHAGLAVAAVSAALVLALQALSVHLNYGGQWSGLFCHGEGFAVPPPLEKEEIYRFPGSGYDGQFYHVMAHDPFFRAGLETYVDDPRLRYRRILVPGLAHVLAAGRDSAVDTAYRAVVLLFLALGSFWLSRFATRHGRSAWWGLAFPLVPAAWVSIDRMTVDVALAAFTVGFVLHGAERPGPALLALLALAGLTRETGLLLPAAYALFQLLRRAWRGAVLAGAAMVPAIAWFAFVNAHTAPRAYPHDFVPLRGIVSALTSASPRAPLPEGLSPGMARSRRIARAVDAVLEKTALAGAVLGIALAGAAVWRRPQGPETMLALLFAVMAVFVQRADHWSHAYDYGRVYSPLLIVLALRSLARAEVLPAVPSMLMWPRLLFQVRTQAFGLVRPFLS